MRGDIGRTCSTRSIAAALAGLSAAVAVHAQNRIVYVDASAPAGGDGQSWQTAFNDLQIALLLIHRTNSVGFEAEFRMAGGVYRPDLGTRDRRMPFFVEQGDRIVGGFAGSADPDPHRNDPSLFPTVLTGDLLANDGEDPSSRVDNSLGLVYVDRTPFALASGVSLETVFRNLEMRGSENSGMYTSVIASESSADVLFSGCRISDNHTSALLSGFGLVRCFQTDILHNRIGGFGVCCRQDLRNCKVQGNRATQAGTKLLYLAAFLAPQRMQQCIVTDNIGFDETIDVHAGSLIEFDRCTIARNAAVRDVLRISGDSYKISNCIFALNSGSLSGQISAYNCSPSAFASPNVFDFTYPQFCLPAVPQLIHPDPFVDSDGPDNDPLTWADNDYTPKAPALDRAYIAGGGNYPIRDINGHTPFDAPGAPNLGQGASAFADLGAIEFVPSAQQPSCPADFNHSGAVTVQDVFDYLTAYFNGCP